jgi:hypothetical protein
MGEKINGGSKMTIIFDAGHWSLLIVIAMLILKQMFTAWMVTKERGDLQNKLLAGNGTLDTYVSGQMRLDGAVDKQEVEEEVEQRLDDLYAQDTVEIS